MFPGGHAGLDAALTSVRNKRSPKNAYILLMGLTGSGKSSTINFLFDNSTICKIGSFTSTTASIDEYRIPVQVDELGCQNCELRVIDTPGFHDTKGLETDAKYLAGLETFLNNHEELRHRRPNIVLVVSKFTDNRFIGKTSAFVKALRAIDLFGEKLLDSKYSNVINVLTHFMSATTKVQRNPANKLRQFREVIRENTLFSKPIVTVIAENKPEDQDVVMVNSYYLLPKGEYYPQNLFEKIQESTERGQDPVGEAIIRTAFKYPENFNISRNQFLLKNVTFSREPYYLAELSLANFNIELTEVSNITAIVYKKEIPGHMKVTYPGCLEYIQRILNLRRIYNKEDIPRTRIGILKLFKHIRQNPLVQLLLLKAFDLETPKLEVPLLTGQCYNMLKDTVLPASPFQVTSYLDSDTGFKFPDIIKSSISNEQVDVFNFFETRKEYSMDRIQNQLNVEGFVKTDDLNLEPRPGFNTLEAFNRPADSKQRRLVSSIREYRLFKLSLNESAEFNVQFIDRVKNIPHVDPQNYTIVEDWKRFFNDYGTHVVSSAYGGGAIQIEFKVKNNTLTSAQARLTVKKSIEDFFKFLDDVHLGKALAVNDIDTKFVKYLLNFLGGDGNYAVNDFSGSSIDQTSSTLDGFRESLEYNPIMLQTSISLIPLCVLVQKLDKNLSFKVSDATVTLLNASLSYTPPPPPPPPLERPEVIKYIDDLRAQFKANLDILSHELEVSRQTVDNITADLVKKNDQEREEMTVKLKDSRWNVLSIVLIVLLVIIVVFLLFRIWRRQKIFRELNEEELNYFENGATTETTMDGALHEVAMHLPYNREQFEIPRDMFIYEEKSTNILGTGAFGCVYKGTHARIATVAIKTVTPKADVIFFKALLSELKLIAYIGDHPNVVGFIGACTKFIRYRILFIILEYCENGSLLDFLEQNGNNFKDLVRNDQITIMAENSQGSDYKSLSELSNGFVLTTMDLVRFSIQIISGLQYLRERGVIHGDLAARNILLDGNLVAKIADFGLSRQLYNSETYVKKTREPLPWRYMAIESLQTRTFSYDSDVWGLGVTLWEIFSLGHVPYAGLTYTEDFIDKILNGKRLSKPIFATSAIYRNVMLPCWRKNPKDRIRLDAAKQIFNSIHLANMYANHDDLAESSSNALNFVTPSMELDTQV